ncbi:MAG: Benzoyl-CoA reductase/2-hydroxyglutaryl-CoA dehydratase subunit [Candidatus Alkanophagales archaeon MCA70_species_1]|nr:Benzoyl-CoA reductase/2-hydroxyglutaryl-CoA dehydratase subunit [Candidatus Alkanophaga volatiphilum]
MTAVAGVDVGSIFTKVVIIDAESRDIISFSIMRSGASHENASRSAAENALKAAGMSFDDLAYVVSTGYGRSRVPFADRQITEITCHARAAKFFFPDAHTIIDIGGQDSKVIRIDDDGKVVNFVMNDRCAAGTGRFLEVMAAALEVDLEKLSELARKAKRHVEVSSVCAVFAESEVISLIASGHEKTDIAAAIFRAIARRRHGRTAWDPRACRDDRRCREERRRRPSA